MRKLITSMLSLMVISSSLISQNLVTNPGFESAASTYTVLEGSDNVLMRVGNLTDAITQIASPTATATTVSAGMWVKKAANSSYVKAIVNPADKHSGNLSLHLKINQNSSQTGHGSWYNCVGLQKLSTGLSHSKKYIASVWAKVDDTANNQCTQMTLFITGLTPNLNYTKVIDLTGGTTWTQYQITFDLPYWTTTYPTANFGTTYFGIGVTTSYNSENKTLYSGLLVDDFSVTEDTSTGLEEAQQQATISVNNGFVTVGNLIANEQVSVYSVSGKQVLSVVSPNEKVEFQLSKGIYILKTRNTNSKLAIQ